MRNFNWETLPKHSVVGKHNIWTTDKIDGEYELDTDHMEELFSHKQVQQQLKAQNRQSLRGIPTNAPGGEMVSILSSKRSMNIAIFLKQFKRPVKDMIEDIKSGRSLSFGCGKLRELCKLLPDEGEVKQLVSFKGDHFSLPEADLFMRMLVKVPSYEERLSSLVLKEEFLPLMDEMKGFICTLTAAAQELMESDHLHSVIRLVLKTGNYMNAGSYAGSAIGFRMASLLKLVDTKANKPGMNLMHYVVMQAQKADVALLKFPEQLKHIEAAARINKCDVEAEFGRQVKKVQDANVDTLKQEDLKAQMENFLKEAEVCLAEIETDFQELQSVSDSVAEYFCEDPEKFKLEECCSIFKSFCEKFMRAMQENKAREMTEVKRRHRDRLQSSAKRRSTATCSSRDKEMDGVALESVLQNLLTNRVSRRRSGRPFSTQGSPMGGSPNNSSLIEMTSQVNLPTGNQKMSAHLLSSLAAEMGRKEWNSAAELTGNSSQNKVQSSGVNDKANCVIPHEEEMKTSGKEDPRGFAHPAKRTSSISSSVKSFSATADDDEEDIQDNNQEEAQKLREASRKVLRFQNSRSSVSSADYSLENQKSPAASTTLPRQRTFDEETDRYPGDPTNDELISFLISPSSTSKRNLGRRHTMPPKVLKTEEEEDKLWDQPPNRTPNLVAGDKGTRPAEGAEHNPSKQVFDFSDVSPNFKKSDAPDQNPPSAENNVSSATVPDEGPGEPHQEGKSVEPSGDHVRRNSENIRPKSTWIKTETSGLFFSFFKRLGDMGKQQNSKETVHKGTDSDRPCPFLSVACSVDSVGEDWDTDNGKTSPRPAMLTLPPLPPAGNSFLYDTPVMDNEK
ncbi:putative FH2 domain-containing protein 1-like [Scophthalmus maximus]|uniref:Putative FH2 domain-containing protein 1-like n=1 Tax=Scophthalmus maximus TaxID=52904 RepID=A0A2U9B4B1_SCOMX|nr:putative FH2 domain-containing protein 1-like [Scophthalmus maximus]